MALIMNNRNHRGILVKMMTTKRRETPSSSSATTTITSSKKNNSNSCIYGLLVCGYLVLMVFLVHGHLHMLGEGESASQYHRQASAVDIAEIGSSSSSESSSSDGSSSSSNNLRGPTTSNDQKQQQQQQQLSPFYSVKPLDHSLHPVWKLWTEMDAQEQNEAIVQVGRYMKKYGAMIHTPGQPKKTNLKLGTCVLDERIGSTGHRLCGPPPIATTVTENTSTATENPPPPCTFISFGINDDPSWDREVADHWGCRGFAGDPTVQHPSKIHDRVTFHNVGATTLSANEERINNKGGTTEDWWTTSMPRLRYFLGLEKIDVLKLDCEGCEVAFARDIIREDPAFLTHVDQISIETHTTKTWVSTREHVYYFGLMFALLEEAGFKMEWSSVFGCSKRHEITGCMPEFEQYGWPCGYKPWPGHPNVVHGYSCQEFTWKRYDGAHQQEQHQQPREEKGSMLVAQE